MSRRLLVGLLAFATLLPLAIAAAPERAAVNRTDCATVTTVGPVLSTIRTVCATARASYTVTCSRNPGEVLACDLDASVGGGGSNGDLGLPGTFYWRGVVRSTWCDTYICEARDTIEEDHGAWDAGPGASAGSDRRFTNHFETRATAQNPCIHYDADAFSDSYTYTPGADLRAATLTLWAKHLEVETPQADERFCL